MFVRVKRHAHVPLSGTQANYIKYMVVYARVCVGVFRSSLSCLADLIRSYSVLNHY